MRGGRKRDCDKTSLGGFFAFRELTLLWTGPYFILIGTPYGWLPTDLMSPVRFPVVCPLEKFSLRMQPDLYFFFSRFPFNRPFYIVRALFEIWLLFPEVFLRIALVLYLSLKIANKCMFYMIRIIPISNTTNWATISASSSTLGCKS